MWGDETISQPKIISVRGPCQEKKIIRNWYTLSRKIWRYWFNITLLFLSKNKKNIRLASFHII